MRRAGLFFLLYVFVSLLTRAVVLHGDIVNGDEASYAVAAWEMLSGKLPYTAFVDNKPPLVYAYYAFAQAIGGQGIIAVRLLTAVGMLPLTALGISAFYRHGRRGCLAGVAFLVASASYGASNMLAVNCEVLMMAPLVWAAVMCRDEQPGPGRAFVAGLLIATGVLFKYHAVFWLPALLVPAAFTFTKPTNAVTFSTALLAGVCVPLLGMAALFLWLGGFEGFFYWNVTHNLGYVMNPVSVRSAAVLGLERTGLFVASTAPLWFGAYVSLRRQSTYRRRLLGALVLCSALACVPGLRFFPHYFVVLYAPLTLAAASWINEMVRRPDLAQARIAALYATAWFVASTAVNAWQPRPFLERSHALADRLKRDACYGTGPMFVWGSAPTFYYHAQLPLGSRYFFPEFPLVRYYDGNRSARSAQSRPLVRESRRRHWRLLLDDLNRTAPIYVIDASGVPLSAWQQFPMDDYPWLSTFVTHNYSLIDTVNDVRIYRRDGCEASLQFAKTAP